MHFQHSIPWPEDQDSFVFPCMTSLMSKNLLTQKLVDAGLIEKEKKEEEKSKDDKKKEKEDKIIDKWYVLYLKHAQIQQKILPSKDKAQEYYATLRPGIKVIYHHGKTIQREEGKNPMETKWMDEAVEKVNPFDWLRS